MPHIYNRSRKPSILEVDGNIYTPVEKPLGEGEYDRARMFSSASTSKQFVVLNPKQPSRCTTEQIRRKYHFFQQLYPELCDEISMHPQIINASTDYRVVLPFIPGVPYRQLQISNHYDQVLLFKNTVEAVLKCHRKGIVIVDLNRSNIFYDERTGLTYLIDGGLSCNVGERFASFSGQSGNFAVAPECFHKSPQQVSAVFSMDVYSIGFIMRQILVNPPEDVQTLIQTCLNPTPGLRILIDALYACLVVLEEQALDQDTSDRLDLMNARHNPFSRHYDPSRAPFYP